MITKSSRPSRDLSIDTISGILIIYMILRHCMQRTNTQESYLYDSIKYLSFFMPWFFYKSGMFYRCESLKSIINGGGKLLYPFCCFGLVGHILECLRLWQDGVNQLGPYIVTPVMQLVKQGSFYGNLPLWFLLTLFIVKVLACRYCQYRNWAIVVAIVVIFLSFLLNRIDLEYPYYLSNVLSGMFFYTMGCLLRQKQYSKMILLTSIIIYLIVGIICYTQVDMRSNRVSEGEYALWPLFSLSGIIILNNIFKLANVKVACLVYIGKNSMDFYVTHWLIISSVLLMLKQFGFPDIGFSALIITVLALLIFYSIKHIAFSYARR